MHDGVGFPSVKTCYPVGVLPPAPSPFGNLLHFGEEVPAYVVFSEAESINLVLLCGL